MTRLAFIKMHGLGNDFVVVDRRDGGVALDDATVRALADRRTGVGCDQLIVLEPSTRAHVFMRIYNPDASEAGACGNATRCVAALVGGEVTVETVAGLLACRNLGDEIEVDMGPVRTAWDAIPLAEPDPDTARVDLTVGPLTGPACCNVGNPHATFFVLDPKAVDLADLGPGIEHHPRFPERVNVGVCAVEAPDRLRLRVWERGAGLTRACGSAACAALVGAVRRGFAAPRATVHLDGGPLVITWREDDGHVTMRGPATRVFDGTLDLEALGCGSA
ncbi:MAG: diaminopimelate epimerase [Alphaproteobacteria bacterium]